MEKDRGKKANFLIELYAAQLQLQVRFRSVGLTWARVRLAASDIVHVLAVNCELQLKIRRLFSVLARFTGYPPRRGICYSNLEAASALLNARA